MRREADPVDRRKSHAVATPTGVGVVMQEGRARRVMALTQTLAGLDRGQRATLDAAVAILEALPTGKR